MKKTILTTALISLFVSPVCLLAQDGNKKEKKSEEIIIRNKGDKEMNLKVEIDGDKVTINGKPLAEFKDENVTINKKKIIINDGENNMAFSFGEGGNLFNMDGEDNMDMEEHPGADKKAFLGVTTEAKNEEKGGDIKSIGAVITNVTKLSAAEKAGLKTGDIITKINEKEISDPGVLSEVVSSFAPKEEVTITFKREGKEKKVKAVLGERKISKARIFTFRGPQGDVRSFSIPRMPQAPYMNGENLRELENLSRGLNNDFAPFEQMEENFNFPKQKKLGLKIQDTEEGGNVKVIAVEDSSAAALAGLQKDDLIEEINGKKIDNTDDAREELVPEEGKKSYKMKIIRNKQEMNIDVKIPRKLKTANL